MIYKKIYYTPAGFDNLIIQSQNGITAGIYFDNGSGISAAAEGLFCEEAAVFKEVSAWLDRYFAGEKPCVDIPFSVKGVTPFCSGVLSLLTEIPYGETVTYGYLAKRMCEKYGYERMSAQAIGGAVKRNPLSIIIPCHRVIGADGSLTGYAGGINNKKSLLQLEKST